jgi:hypothetical protein
VAEHKKLLFAAKTSRPAVCPHLVSYSMGERGSLRGVKAARE